MNSEEFIEIEEMNSDDALREYIEIDEATIEPVKQPRTTKAQTKMLIDFAAEHDEEMYAKRTYADLWDALSKDLNNIGPPKRSSSDWKRVWSVYKYNKKKKEAQVGAEGIEHSSSLDEPSHSTQQPIQPVEVIGAGVSVEYGKHDFQQEILRILSLVVQKLDKSNLLLEEIAKKSL